MNKTTRILIGASVAALLLSGCASTGGPVRLAAADGVQSDAGSTRTSHWRLNCAGQPKDASLEAARCARAELVRSIGPSAPALTY